MKNKNSFEQKLKNRKINENLSILGRNELLNPCFQQLVYGTTILWPLQMKRNYYVLHGNRYR